MKLILASGSPRRRELLTKVGLPFECAASDADETCDLTRPPAEIVRELALKKARWVAEKTKSAGTVVLGADTVVAIDGQILGKPKDEGDAARMLRLLAGREHTVFTGIALIGKEVTVNGVEKTVVKFRELDEAEITAYIASGEPMDKAGAYGIQGLGSALVERIEGDYFNVMGLPVCKTCQLLKHFFGLNALALKGDHIAVK